MFYIVTDFFASMLHNVRNARWNNIALNVPLCLRYVRLRIYAWYVLRSVPTDYSILRGVVLHIIPHSTALYK